MSEDGDNLGERSVVENQLSTPPCGYMGDLDPIWVNRGDARPKSALFAFIDDDRRAARHDSHPMLRNRDLRSLPRGRDVETGAESRHRAAGDQNGEGPVGVRRDVEPSLTPQAASRFSCLR